jgi:predicted ferric reductase
MIPTRIRPTVAIAVTFTVNAMVWAFALWQFGPGWPVPNVVAEFFSTSALVIASTNLLLSTRARPFEDTFGGLDKMFTSHRLNGLAVALLVVSHFLIVPKFTPYGPSGWLGFTAITLIVSSVVVAIAPRSPWRRLVPLRYQDWKLTHRTMGLLIALAATHSLVAHRFSRALPPVTVWAYGVVLVGLTAYAFRETLERPLLQRHRYRVAEPRHVTADVLEIPLEPVEHAIGHRAGQFAFVRFEAGPTHEQHPFTISIPPSDGRLRFSVKASGDYTEALQTHLAAGSPARIEGPYGRFDYRTAGPRQLWIAGGIGITPFLAFLPTLDDTRDVRLVWSVRSPADAAYRQEVEAVDAANRRLSVTIHESATSGRLHMADLDIEEPRRLDVFICGPVPMRKAFIEELRALGVRRDHIYFEEFSLR